MVVPVTGDDAKDAALWSRALDFVLDDRDRAFARASQLRAEMATACGWPAEIAALLAALAAPAPAPSA